MSHPLASTIAPAARTASLALLILGLATAPAPAQSEPKDVRPSEEKVDANYLARRWAQSDLAKLADALRRYRADHAGFPAGDAAKALEPDYAAPAPKDDPWGTPYQFDLAAAKPRIVSAGPDKAFGNADDVALGIDEAPPLPEAREVTPRTTEAGSSSEAPPHREPVLPAVPAEQSTTFARMQRLADALEAYRLDKGFYPVAEDSAALKAALVPGRMSASDWSATDGWGHDWRYRVTDDGHSYTLVSAGSDGEFEMLTPLLPGPVGSPAKDLVLANNSFQRWPAGTGGTRSEGMSRGEAGRERRGGETPAAEPARSSERAGSTAQLLKSFGASIDAYKRQHGTYPEFDDCARLAEVLGARATCEDTWGHSIGYLTQGGGTRYVLVSPGANGAFEKGLEDYAAGAKPSSAAGADVVLLNGNLVAP